MVRIAISIALALLAFSSGVSQSATFEEVMALFDGGQCVEARQQFTEFSTANPDDLRVPQARYYATLCLFNLEEYDDFEREATAFLSDETINGYREYLLFYLARSYQERTQLQSAIDGFSSFLTEFPESDLADDAIYYQALAYHDSGESETACAQLDSLLADYPNSNVATEAQSLLEACNQVAFSAGILSSEGHTFFSAGDYDSAIIKFEALVNQGADEQTLADARLHIAYSHFLKGDYDLAVESYNSFISLHPDSSATDNARYHSAHSHFLKGEYTLAIQGYQELLSLHPESTFASDAHYNSAWASMQQNDFDNAIVGFQQVLEISPESSLAPSAQYYLPYSRHHKGDYEQARTGFENFLAAYPNSENSDDARYLMAHGNFLKGEYKKAIEDYKVMLEKHSGSELADDASMHCAYSNLLQGNLAEALQGYDAFLVEFPDSELIEDAEWKKAYILFESGQWDEAYIGFDDYIAKYPQTALGLYTLQLQGRILLGKAADMKRAGDVSADDVKQQARSLLEAVVTQTEDCGVQAQLKEYDSDLAARKFLRVEAMFYLNKYRAVVEETEDFLANYDKTDTAWADAQLWLGGGKIYTGDLDGAIEAFETVLYTVLEGDPAPRLSAVAAIWRIHIAEQQKDYDTARMVLTMMREEMQQTKLVTDTLARCQWLFEL